MCFSLCSSVFAAELDSEAIYNFNQLYQNPNFSSDSNVSSYGGGSYSIDNSLLVINNVSNGGVFLSSINFDTSHYFYVSFVALAENDTTLFFGVRRIKQFSVNITTSFSSYGFVVSPGVNGPTYGNVCYVTSNSVDFTLKYFSVIDLTIMFGSGNEPTLEQCQQIFTAEYYNYTTGTPLSLSGVNAYQQGVNDTLNSYNVVTNPIITFQQCFSVNIANSHNTIYKISDSSLPYIAFIGGIGLPFLTTLSSGTTVTVYISSLAVPSVTYCDSLSLGYFVDSTYVPLYTFDISSPSSTGSVVFNDVVIDLVLPVDLNYLVLCAFLSSENSINVQVIPRFFDLYMSYKSFNNQILIDNAYNTGYNAGSTAGYNNAYQQGYTAGLADATTNDYSFLGLISSVIEAPVNVLIGEYDSTTGSRVGGLLNFEFLGYNMSTLLMSLFSLGVVICIIRLFI